MHSANRVPSVWWQQIGAGQSIDDILADYPYLEREDVMQALRYAAIHSSSR